MSLESSHHATDPPQVGHVAGFESLVLVIVTLLVLTWMTVVLADFELGQAGVWIALGIAAIKATVVALYFMHLRYDHLLHSFIFLIALAFVVFFIFITVTDTQQSRHTVEAYRAAPMAESPMVE